MKVFKSALFIFMFFVAMISACIKNTVEVNYAKSIPAIILQKDTVNRGEPFIVSALVKDPNTVIKWAIRPSDSTEIIPNGSKATIYITLPGNYLITANLFSPTDTVNAFDSTHSTITVSNTLFVPHGDYDTIALAGQDVTIVPISTSGTLELVLKTNKNYNCTSYFSAVAFAQDTISGGSFGFYLDSAKILVSKADCGGIKNPAIYTAVLSPLSIGVYPFSVILSQTPRAYYYGSVNVTDSNYTFTFPDTSGVTISPKQIKKN